MTSNLVAGGLHAFEPARATRAQDVAPRPWANGGGHTRELLAWPAGTAWTLRISLADIDADGPFSAFAGVERWFAVLEGAGVVLTLRGRAGLLERRLTTADPPWRFDGAAAPDCRVVDGPTRDLNLMLRGGVRGVLERAVDGVAWPDRWHWRACFTSGAAVWHGAAGQVVELGANTLVSNLGPGPCRLVARDRSSPMFWIGAGIEPPQPGR